MRQMQGYTYQGSLKSPPKACLWNDKKVKTYFSDTLLNCTVRLGNRSGSSISGCFSKQPSGMFTQIAVLEISKDAFRVHVFLGALEQKPP